MDGNIKAEKKVECEDMFEKSDKDDDAFDKTEVNEDNKVENDDRKTPLRLIMRVKTTKTIPKKYILMIVMRKPKTLN